MRVTVRIGFFTDSYLPALHGVEVSVEAFRKSGGCTHARDEAG